MWSQNRTICMFVGFGLLLGCPCASVFAQAGAVNPRQQATLDRLKDVLGSAEDEWRVLQPLIQKLMIDQREAGGSQSGGGRGGRGGQIAPDVDPSPVTRATLELQLALQNDKTAPKELARLMAAVREAQENARRQLAEDRQALVELLTMRQEAILLSMGLLD